MECSRGERLAITLAKDNINRSSNRSTTGKLEVDIFELLRDSEYEMGETSKWLKQAMPTNCQGKTEFLYVFYTIYMCVCVRVKEEKRVSKNVKVGCWVQSASRFWISTPVISNLTDVFSLTVLWNVLLTKWKKMTGIVQEHQRCFFLLLF